MSQDELGKGSTGSASPQKDSALTPIEKSSEDAEVDKKPIFNFDVNKAMGSVKDITDKVIEEYFVLVIKGLGNGLLTVWEERKW